MIDTCRVKELTYNLELQATSLVTKLAAQDSLQQRRGRAGRVATGRCFRLVTRHTHSRLAPNGVPEMLRVPLERVLLQVKAVQTTKQRLKQQQQQQQQLDPSNSSYSSPSFIFSSSSGSSSSSRINNGSAGIQTELPSSMVLLSKCPDVPSQQAVASAEQYLVQIGALDPETGALTALGGHLTSLPCAPRVGKMLIYGVLLCCTFPASCVAAGLTVRSPFLTPQHADAYQQMLLAEQQRRQGGEAMQQLLRRPELKSDYAVLVDVVRQFHTLGVGASTAPLNRSSSGRSGDGGGGGGGGYQRQQRAFCKQHGLSYDRVAEIADTQRDLLEGLVQLGLLGSVAEAFLPPHSSEPSQSLQQQQLELRQRARNCNADKSRVLSAVYCAGLYPQVARVLRPVKRFKEVMGSAMERNVEAKELKFYILSDQWTESVATATATAGAARIGSSSGQCSIGGGNKSSNGSGAEGKPLHLTPEQQEQREKWQLQNKARDVDISTEGKTRVFLHPSSVNFHNSAFQASNYILYGERSLVAYQRAPAAASSGKGKGKGSGGGKLYLRQISEVSPLALLFLGGRLSVDYEQGTVSVDGWVRFSAPGRTVALLQALRAALDRLLGEQLLHPQEGPLQQQLMMISSQKGKGIGEEGLGECGQWAAVQDAVCSLLECDGGD